MRKIALLLAIAALPIAACSNQGGLGGKDRIPASETAVAEAKKAASICSRHAPNGRAAIKSLQASGFAPTTDQRFENLQQEKADSVFLGLVQKEDHGVVVYVRSRSAKQSSVYCSISVDNMTVEQGRQVAQVWGEKYNATPDRLFSYFALKDDILGWQALSDTWFVQIGMKNTPRNRDKRGATVILRYETKDAGTPVSKGVFQVTKTR